MNQLYVLSFLVKMSQPTKKKSYDIRYKCFMILNDLLCLFHIIHIITSYQSHVFLLNFKILSTAWVNDLIWLLSILLNKNTIWRMKSEINSLAQEVVT